MDSSFKDRKRTGYIRAINTQNVRSLTYSSKDLGESRMEKIIKSIESNRVIPVDTSPNPQRGYPEYWDQLVVHTSGTLINITKPMKTARSTSGGIERDLSHPILISFSYHPDNEGEALTFISELGLPL